jgi:hypothetical protein
MGRFLVSADLLPVAVFADTASLVAYALGLMF